MKQPATKKKPAAATAKPKAEKRPKRVPAPFKATPSAEIPDPTLFMSFEPEEAIIPQGLDSPEDEPPLAEGAVDILDSVFVTSMARWKDTLEGEEPLVCFAGRSNVGKSTLLNTLCGRRQLARVSNTPGRTQLINIFRITLRKGAERRKIFFGDLPGYGYAKAPDSVRKNWIPMISSLLRNNERLSAVLLLLDIRHQPTAQDVDLLELLDEFQVGVIPVATKCDKVTRNQIGKHYREMAEATGVAQEDIRPFSALQKIGVQELLLDLWDLAEKRPKETLSQQGQ